MAVNAMGFLAAPLALRSATAALCLFRLCAFLHVYGGALACFSPEGLLAGAAAGRRSVLHPVHEALRARGLVLYAALCAAIALRRFCRAGKNGKGTVFYVV